MRRSCGGRRRRRRYADLLLLAALGCKSPERKSLAMSQQQAEGNYGNEGDQPQHDSATGSQFVWNVEDMLQRRNGSKLRAAADARQLNHGAHHAGSHQQQDLSLRYLEFLNTVRVSHFLV